MPTCLIVLGAPYVIRNESVPLLQVGGCLSQRASGAAFRKKGSGRSEWPTYSYCFLKPLQLKMFNTFKVPYFGIAHSELCQTPPLILLPLSPQLSLPATISATKHSSLSTTWSVGQCSWSASWWKYKLDYN